MRLLNECTSVLLGTKADNSDYQNRYQEFAQAILDRISQAEVIEEEQALKDIKESLRDIPAIVPVLEENLSSINRNVNSELLLDVLFDRIKKFADIAQPELVALGHIIMNGQGQENQDKNAIYIIKKILDPKDDNKYRGTFKSLKSDHRLTLINQLVSSPTIIKRLRSAGYPEDSLQKFLAQFVFSDEINIFSQLFENPNILSDEEYLTRLTIGTEVLEIDKAKPSAKDFAEQVYDKWFDRGKRILLSNSTCWI